MEINTELQKMIEQGERELSLREAQEKGDYEKEKREIAAAWEEFLGQARATLPEVVRPYAKARWDALDEMPIRPFAEYKCFEMLIELPGFLAPIGARVNALEQPLYYLPFDCDIFDGRVAVNPEMDSNLSLALAGAKRLSDEWQERLDQCQTQAQNTKILEEPRPLYHVIEVSVPGTLDSVVSTHLNEGWQLYGPMIVTTTSYAQVVVRHLAD